MTAELHDLGRERRARRPASNADEARTGIRALAERAQAIREDTADALLVDRAVLDELAADVIGVCGWLVGADRSAAQ